jgi:hypothetical protein
LLIGVLVYDGAAAALLGYAGLFSDLVGIALWPAVALHTALAVWCVLCLWVNKKIQEKDWGSRCDRE